MYHFRIRRGIVVEIPAKYVGVFPTNKTKRNRKIDARRKVLNRKIRLLKDERFAFKHQEEYENDNQKSCSEFHGEIQSAINIC